MNQNLSRFHVNTFNLVQLEINPHMVSILYEWLFEVCQSLNFKCYSDNHYRSTIYFDTVNLLDFLFCKISVKKERLQLYGITCLMMVSKIYYRFGLNAIYCAKITNSSYTEDEVLECEKELFRIFRGDLGHNNNDIIVDRIDGSDQLQSYHHSNNILFSKCTEIIGSGTYGILYKTDNKDICYKKILDYTEEYGISSSVYREILYSKQCQHQNVLRIISVDYNGILVEAIETNLEAFSAHNDLSKNHPLQLKIFYQLYAGLHHIHSQRIMHRDLKLTNILFRNEEVKIADLGSATKIKFKNNSHCYSDKLSTYCYAAPEVLLGIEYDERIDVWSLGICLFNMVNRTPFISGDNIDSCLISIFSITYPPKLSSTDFDKILSDYITRCLMIDCCDRPRLYHSLSYD